MLVNTSFMPEPRRTSQPFSAEPCRSIAPKGSRYDRYLLSLLGKSEQTCRPFLVANVGGQTYLIQTFT